MYNSRIYVFIALVLLFISTGASNQSVKAKRAGKNETMKIGTCYSIGPKDSEVYVTLKKARYTIYLETLPAPQFAPRANRLLVCDLTVVNPSNTPLAIDKYGGFRCETLYSGTHDSESWFDSEETRIADQGWIHRFYDSQTLKPVTQLEPKQRLDILVVSTIANNEPRVLLQIFVRDRRNLGIDFSLPENKKKYYETPSLFFYYWRPTQLTEFQAKDVDGIPTADDQFIEGTAPARLGPWQVEIKKCESLKDDLGAAGELVTVKFTNMSQVNLPLTQTSIVVQYTGSDGKATSQRLGPECKRGTQDIVLQPGQSAEGTFALVNSSIGSRDYIAIGVIPQMRRAIYKHP